MASLYVTIKLQGVGWGGSGSVPEKAYEDLVELIARTVSADPRFCDSSDVKTVSIQIRGYDPIVKGVVLHKPLPPGAVLELAQPLTTDL